MMEESRFNGEYRKTGSAEITDDDKERVKKADEKLSKTLGSSG